MKHIKEFAEFINEAKITKGSDIVKIMSNSQEWGPDMKDRVFTKGKNFIFADTFFYNEKNALDMLIQSWSPGGLYYDYFKDDYGIEVEIVATFSDFKAKGRFKKLTDDGVVYLELAIKNVNESLLIGHAEVVRAEKNLPAGQKELLAKEIKSGKIKTSQDLRDWLANIDESHEYFANMPKESTLSEYLSDTEEAEISKNNPDLISDKTIANLWKDVYDEEFSSSYPSIWKILKQRPPITKKEFNRIWTDTYETDLKKSKPEFWERLK